MTLQAEVVGKKLLSFLPDEEKTEVYNNITLRLPLSNPEENHIEFCCHFKRQSIEYGERPVYKYAKFILNVKDIFQDPLVLFGGSTYNHISAGPPALRLPVLPLEERFYLVGTVCVLRPQVLWKHGFNKTTKQSFPVLSKFPKQTVEAATGLVLTQSDATVSPNPSVLGHH
ncbi:circadian clock protein PASD1-like [Tamandua tetradactyla]|uniref:circadian clock protein PASD1-like n=1 Tax=Tamandua tetradactyla TaxID=48850 RepID=UPI004053AA06